MYNDSVETLLLRHYGDNGPTPADLEQRLVNSVRQDAMIQQEQSGVGRALRHRMSRRRVMRFVAIGSGGLGLVVASLEVLDATIFGRDATRSALS
jgi:hypothetical protein